tara:strand:- start:2092 stop:2721 length:630 start_codon:yes stop_codon:yes gene_type:complete
MAQRRGRGYWLWKPYLINEALQAASDGDLILYTDAAVTIVSDPAPLLAVTELHPIVLFNQGDLLSAFTKRDAFVLMNADTEHFWSAPMLTATFQIYRACDESRSFVKEWLSFCSDVRVLTDIENSQGQPNFPDFHDHRHDQSILSILAARERVPIQIDPSQWGNNSRSTKSSYGQIFDHHRRKTPPLFGGVRSRLQIGTRIRRAISILR